MHERKEEDRVENVITSNGYTRFNVILCHFQSKIKVKLKDLFEETKKKELRL